MVGARTATPTAASPTPAVLTEPIAPPLVMRMLAGMPRRWGATGWWDGLTRRSDEWWRTGRRRAVVALGRGAIRQRRPILAIGIHFHVIGLEGGTRLRWARAAPTTGRASAFVHATRCVVVDSRRARPYGACPIRPLGFLVSAPRCTRLFQGALVHGRPGDAPVVLSCCCRRRRGTTDDSRASGACSAQPERLRACVAALLHYQG